ncbi:MAG: Type II secretion system protein G [Syntrophomonadaceae bacterium]|nr:Type II secretion system protein G [Bacillota bacterium]
MSTYLRNKTSIRGFSLLEILVAITIIAILAAFMGVQVKNLTQRARVAAAKSTISGFGLALSSIKIHTGVYPQFLADTMEVHPPADFIGAGIGGWWGPYAEGLSPIDPWGNPYLYFLDEGNLFSPAPIQRFHGKPGTHTFNFTAGHGKGTIVVDNYGVTAGWIELNGKRIISPDKFKKKVSIIELPITLLSGNNTLEIRVASKPTTFIDVRITSWVSVETTFTLLSHGADGKPGGTGFNADIIYGKF